MLLRLSKLKLNYEISRIFKLSIPQVRHLLSLVSHSPLLGSIRIQEVLLCTGCDEYPVGKETPNIILVTRK